MLVLGGHHGPAPRLGLGSIAAVTTLLLAGQAEANANTTTLSHNVSLSDQSPLFQYYPYRSGFFSQGWNDSYVNISWAAHFPDYYVPPSASSYHYTEHAGSTVSLSFPGTAIYLRGNVAASGSYQVTLDGVVIRTNYADKTTVGANDVLFKAEGLSAGMHQVKMEVLANKSGVVFAGAVYTVGLPSDGSNLTTQEYDAVNSDGSFDPLFHTYGDWRANTLGNTVATTAAPGLLLPGQYPRLDATSQNSYLTFTTARNASMVVLRGTISLENGNYSVALTPTYSLSDLLNYTTPNQTFNGYSSWLETNVIKYVSALDPRTTYDVELRLTDTAGNKTDLGSVTYLYATDNTTQWDGGAGGGGGGSGNDSSGGGSSAGSSTSNTHAIVGGVVGGVVAVILALIGLWLWRRNKKRHTRQTRQAEVFEIDGGYTETAERGEGEGRVIPFYPPGDASAAYHEAADPSRARLLSVAPHSGDPSPSTSDEGDRNPFNTPSASSNPTMSSALSPPGGQYTDDRAMSLKRALLSPEALPSPGRGTESSGMEMSEISGRGAVTQGGGGGGGGETGPWQEEDAGRIDERGAVPPSYDPRWAGPGRPHTMEDASSAGGASVDGGTGTTRRGADGLPPGAAISGGGGNIKR